MQRVRLVEELEGLGIPPARIAAAISNGALTLSYLDRLPAAPARLAETYAELCNKIEVPFVLVDRIYASFGLPRPQPDERVREEDLGVISDLPILLTSGLRESEVLRAARVWGEGANKVAQHQVNSFHELIEEPFRAQGLSEDRVLDTALSQIGVRLIPYCGRLVGWLYRRHFERYATEHRVGHVETALETAGLQRKSAQQPAACVFADLSGYTQLTDRLGDAASADISLRLAELIHDVANHHDGRVVKMLGDGVHLFFSDPPKAVLGSLELVERAEQEGLPPAGAGVNAGPMIYIDGDYYGLAVIIAARIAMDAGPGQVLVGEPIIDADNPEGVRFEKIGPVSLKGVGRPVLIYRALRETS